MIDAFDVMMDALDRTEETLAKPAKHTPGPWEINPHEAEYMAIKSLAPDYQVERHLMLAASGKNKFRALSVGNKRFGQVAIIPLDESNIANAKIVAAALDMAEALKDLLGRVAEAEEDGFHGRRDNREAKDKARAALIKAGVE